LFRTLRSHSLCCSPSEQRRAPSCRCKPTIRQERSPAHLLPRVVGLSTASVPVATPIGVLVTGLLIDGLGLHQTLLLTTAGAALIGATVLTSKSTEHFDAIEATQSPSTVRTAPVTAGRG